jgi:hypothetical protein
VNIFSDYSFLSLIPLGFLSDFRGPLYAGGITTIFNGTMESCANYGNITGLNGIPAIGGLAENSLHNQATNYYNCYNAGTISTPNNTTWQGLAGLLGNGAIGVRSQPGTEEYVRSPVINSFNYGAVRINNDTEGGPVFDGSFFGGPTGFERFENVFYLNTDMTPTKNAKTCITDMLKGEIFF